MSMNKLIFGLGVGFIAGLLMAPKKGSEILKDFKHASKDTYDKVSKLSREDIEKAVNEYYDKLVAKISEFNDNNSTTQEKLAELRASVDELARKALADNNINVDEIVAKVNKIAQEAADKVEEYRSEMLENTNIDTQNIHIKLNQVIEKEKEEIQKIINDIDHKE